MWGRDRKGADLHRYGLLESQRVSDEDAEAEREVRTEVEGCQVSVVREKKEGMERDGKGVHV